MKNNSIYAPLERSYISFSKIIRKGIETFVRNSNRKPLMTPTQQIATFTYDPNPSINLTPVSKTKFPQVTIATNSSGSLLKICLQISVNSLCLLITYEGVISIPKPNQPTKSFINQLPLTSVCYIPIAFVACIFIKKQL